MNRTRLILSIFVCLVSATAAGAAERPNIIYVMLDYAGYSDLRTFGLQNVKTPTFVAMCNDGMKFTQHYSGS